jgi:hypothetical protein
MRITRQQLNKLLEGIATAHYQILTYGWGDVPDLLAREDIIYPFMMVTPQASVYGDNTIDHTYTISIADRVLKDKENEVAVDSDTHEILMHVVTQLDNLLYDDVDLIKGVSVTPFFDNFRHEVTGHFANVTVQVMYNYDACAVPSDNVPLPIPPPSDCADASYRVQYENGTLIQEGTIPSGGSIVVDVPNIVPCADATWELRDSDGVLLDSGSIASGGSATITAPDGAVTITDSDGATLYVVNVTSGGTETQAIGDSSVEVRNSLNAVVDSGVVKAQGSGVFSAPDANVTVNGDASFGTIPSDGSKNILVENTDGAPVGAFDGNSNSWVVADSTVNVRKSDATLIQAVTVAAEDTESVNVADSVAVLKDTAANVISSTNIKATETEDIIAPDGSLQNSDASATLTVRSGEVNKAIADVNIEVNTVVEGQVPALKDVKILITDGVNPVTPDDVSVVGDTVTVEVPSGGAVMNVDFSVDKVVADLGETITFTDLTDNSPTHWSWRFDNAGESIVQNPTFSFLTTGFKNITLLAGKVGAGGVEVKNSFIEILAALLLDAFPNAAAAYSLRKLRAAYTGSAIRVRRSSDNTEQDIGFNGSNGLDTTALATFVGAGNGFVTTWYDQSGNGRDVTQTSSANQPQIVNSGSVILENGKPAVQFNGTSNVLTASTASNWNFLHQAGIYFNFGVAKAGDNVDPNNIYAIWGNTSTVSQNGSYLAYDDRVSSSRNDALFQVIGASNNNPVVLNVVNNYQSANIQFMHTVKADPNNATASERSAIATNGRAFNKNNTASFTASTNAATRPLSIGAIPDASNVLIAFMKGAIQEQIFYASDQSSNQTPIELNINTYYNVF